jgi:hypothetical protein
VIFALGWVCRHVGDAGAGPRCPTTLQLEEPKAKVHFDVSMALDGFITGPDEGVEKP